MPIEITFLRHAETVANATGVWQGHGDTPLSDRGRMQVDELALRMRGRPYDLVVTSDLGRTIATAEGFTDRAEPDAAWREADIGSWEGLTREQIAEQHGEDLLAMSRRQDVRMGGGETYAEFAARIESALTATLARLEDGNRALVVAHGGVIGSIVRNVLDADGGGRRPATRLDNTSLTTIRFFDDGARQLSVFNDRAHLNGAAGGKGEVWLIRHGQSEANVANRWQGTTDGLLTAEGRRQAVRLAEWGLPLDAVYSSPLSRAMSTATPIAESRGTDPIARSDVKEFHFGAWENLTTEEIMASRPDEWQRVIIDAEDLPRGGDGDTWAGVAERMSAAVSDVASRHEDATAGVVTHGGATQALVGTILGLEFDKRLRLAVPDNTSVSRVRTDDGRLVLDSYNLTPHLES